MVQQSRRAWSSEKKKKSLVERKKQRARKKTNYNTQIMKRNNHPRWTFEDCTLYEGGLRKKAPTKKIYDLGTLYRSHGMCLVDSRETGSIFLLDLMDHAVAPVLRTSYIYMYILKHNFRQQVTVFVVVASTYPKDQASDGNRIILPRTLRTTLEHTAEEAGQTRQTERGARESTQKKH